MNTAANIVAGPWLWKHGEYAYCLMLVRNGGDANVGYSRAAVHSYLGVQIGSGRLGGRTDVVKALSRLAAENAVLS